MRKRNLLIAGLACLIALLFNAQMVLAHEAITVGDYTIEIGWLSEPPIVGQQNAIVVNVSTTSDEQPVEDVSGLTVTVSYGGQEKLLTLQPLGEDTPGQFIAPILPTVPGQYTLKLGGSLGDTPADVEVEPEEVEPADTLQFPSIESTNQSASTAAMNWLIYLSLLIGLIALVLGVMALQKRS
jgi:hypothetical protein